MVMGDRDLKLLFELSRNSRQPHSRIGKRIGLSQQMVSYKMKNFLDSGLISSFYPLIDYSRFGYLSFRVFFRVNYINRKRFTELIHNLSGEDSIVEIIECGGRHDLIIVFSAKNPSSFNKTLKKVIFENPQLKNYTILTTVVGHVFSRNYLAKKSNPQPDDIIIGGDRELLAIDDVDKRILFELQKDAAKPSVEISKSARVNAKTVISRIRKLHEMEIVKGFKPLFNIQEIGHKNKILLKYLRLSPEWEKRVNDFCIANPNVTELIKLFGEWDAEVTVESMTMEDFRNVYMQIKEIFEEVIADSESFPVFGTYKKHMLPNSFFSAVPSNRPARSMPQKASPPA